MDQTFKRSFQLSLAIHLLPILLLARGCGGMDGGNGDKDKGAGKEQGSKDKIAEKMVKDKAKPKTIEVTLVHLKHPKQPPKPKAKHADKECPSGKFYGGLGIYELGTTNGLTIVENAVKGYPGADIGLEFGDIILSPPQDQIKGEVGTEVTLIVKKNKNGDIKTYRVIRDKICLE